MNSTELQERVNALIEKRLKLKTKAWFRGIQVVYGLFWFATEIFLIAIAFATENLWTFLIGSLVIYSMFQGIKKIGYYIILGGVDSIEPEQRHLLDSKLPNHG